MATPANFNPTKSWPVLVTCSTSDFKRQNRNDLTDFYKRVGLSEGWVLLAGDGPQHAKNDNVAWRESMTLAAIDALHRSFPGAEKWPIACAGFSGGGKGVGYVAPFLAKNGCRVIGVYMTGANEDHLSDGYATLRPGPNFLDTPIYVSAGHEDRIATLSNNTPWWVRSSGPALSGFESELFVAATRSMTPRPRSRCTGFANWRNRPREKNQKRRCSGALQNASPISLSC